MNKCYKNIYSFKITIFFIKKKIKKHLHINIRKTEYHQDIKIIFLILLLSTKYENDLYGI